ncbi:clamp loader subunit [Sinorhizobium phage phiM7]|uniref:Clamp loader subunit n=3 Tax=Emdodecavirus TaxID=1980937 RepID=S5MAN3_9CAUD|nr:clamp loader of DNA polymerase [Sinorhizobium phage phiM12]YP_009212279.1 clamp loader of DNA polymerase [Sinorhizobium phage phiN3]YP_009601149.1 clamp loader of DNA polymerase [Sinorhizobium phage phiM7]AKF12932.1 clamp loader subunit [Sinorhizobium phage phiM19]AGR47668.1 clamp loader subunit [Sinorhizobium phage phiM12]AKF12572.1 clamp loader subunit [Sinorhizobium phage phiM7]AKF13304.2 clamp loader subunit [Sinorhizobium phage phiN3]
MTGYKVFDYVNSINSSRESMMRGTEDDDHAESGYNPYLTNVALSYHIDTVLHANLMNINHHLDNRPQYEFLLNSVRKKKRFAKWHKSVDPANLELICNHYNVNKTIGKEYLDLLPDEEIEKIKQTYTTGGNT